MGLGSITTAQFGFQAIANVGITPGGFQSGPTNSLNIQTGGTFTLGNGANQVDEIISAKIVPNIVAAGHVTLFLGNTLTDLCNQLNVTIARLRGVAVQLLSIAQDSTDGTACSSITLGAAPVSPWTAILNNVGTYTINNGAWMAHGDFGATGLPVAAGANDELLIQNNDALHTACVRVTFYGSSV